MNPRIAVSLLATVLLLSAGIGHAAAPAQPPANPLDVVPAKMPFTTPSLKAA